MAFAHARQQSPKAEMFLIHNDPALSGAIGVGAYAKSMHYAMREWLRVRQVQRQAAKNIHMIKRARA
jgi:hypothetical protein